ncbi:MAG TPA: type II 3-dehydroquinate dehydratase [Acidimicrobiales bacterium]|nr:type II 3-dehydroquinate dehydratase [Acidimicrobiales bacterium]
MSTPAAERDKPRTILLLSGPNLGLLGERQPEIYGTATLADHAERASTAASRYGFELKHLQSEHEADLIAAVHGSRGSVDAIVVNAGALSHSSWALHDALAAFEGVVVELHLSNPDAREPWRRTSVVAPVADGTVAGFGGLGYELAVEAAARLVSGRSGTVPGA